MTKVAAFYNLFTAPMQALGDLKARRPLFGRVKGRVLELGVGTGLSFRIPRPALS